MVYDACWFFGDDFGCRTLEKYFKGRLTVGEAFHSYVNKHFDIRGCFNNVLSDNPSVIGCLGNLMSGALLGAKSGNKILPLPKIIVVVPDDDMIKNLEESMHDTAKAISRLVNYVMGEHDKAIASFKDYIQPKCLKPNYPQIVWIQAPFHDSFPNNSMRYRFNRSLDELAKCHSNVHTLSLKKVWDPKDSDLYLKENQMFTAAGFRSYWEAVDRTVRYFDSVVLKKLDKHKTANSSRALETKGEKSAESSFTSQNDWNHSKGQKDRFRWRNPGVMFKNTPFSRKLPTPSRK